MTKLEPYDVYKYSGFDWLGSIPTHWSVVPGKWLFRLRAERADSDAVHLMASQKYGVISQAQFMAEKDQRVVQTIVGGENMKKICTNDFLIHLRSFQGGIEWSANDGKVSPAYTVLRPNHGVHPQFFYYLLKSDGYVQELRATTNQLRDGQSMNYSQFAMVPLIEVPWKEQVLIAQFLGRETAQIDVLIAKQERLIELLGEKRQAIITQAVTKGLDPVAPTKPSGVHWLGDIPAHWECKQIKWLTQVRRGASPRPIDNPVYFDENGEWSWVRIADVSASDGTLTSTTQRLSELGSSLSVKLEPGSLFVSIAGTVGKPCINQIKACIHDGFVYFPTLRINPQYLFRIFEAGRCYEGLGKMGTQLNLNTDTIGSIYIPVPPEHEIEEILTALSSRLQKIDVLSSKITEFREKLIERRSALISAAVTGKINVDPKELHDA